MFACLVFGYLLIITSYYMSLNIYKTVLKLACKNTYSDISKEEWNKESSILQALKHENICRLFHSDVESPPKCWQKQQDLKSFNIT